MYCENCGTKLDDNVKFCIKCGKRQSSMEQKEEFLVDISIMESSYKKERIKNIVKHLGLVILLALIIFAVVILFLSGVDEAGDNEIVSSPNTYKDEWEQQFVSDCKIVNKEGTTSFNKMNGGLLVEQGEWIYYYVEGENAIYKISPTGTKTLVANNINGACNLNIKGDWLYWNYGGELYKIRTDGNEKTLLLEEACNDFYIYDRYLYYMTGYYDSNKKGLHVIYSVNKIDLDGDFGTVEDLLVVSTDANMGFIGGYDGNIYVYSAESDLSSSDTTLFCEIYSITENDETEKILGLEEKTTRTQRAAYECAIDSTGILWIVYKEEEILEPSINNTYIFDLSTLRLKKMEEAVYPVSENVYIEKMNYNALKNKFVVFNKEDISLYDREVLYENRDRIIEVDDVIAIYCTTQWLYYISSVYDEDQQDYISELHKIDYFGENFEKI